MNAFKRAASTSAAVFLLLLNAAHAEQTFDLPGAQSGYADIVPRS